jgi:hypothetical protein
MKIYVASSWRNIYQPEVVRLCREAGHEPYDFRNPGPGDNGFGWSEIDPKWQTWDFESYRKLLDHPRAEQGFALDMNALKASDACLLVYPSGKSAHLEMGWACGAGKRTAFFVPTDIYHPVGERAREMFKGHTCIQPSTQSLTSGGVGRCDACGNQFGCLLPSKLRATFEPELMVKMGDCFLVGRAELGEWLAGLR